MSAAIIFQAAMAYDLSNSRAMSAWLADEPVPMSWLPDDGSYPWIPARANV